MQLINFFPKILYARHLSKITAGNLLHSYFAAAVIVESSKLPNEAFDNYLDFLSTPHSETIEFIPIHYQILEYLHFLDIDNEKRAKIITNIMPALSSGLMSMSCDFEFDDKHTLIFINYIMLIKRIIFGLSNFDSRSKNEVIKALLNVFPL